MHQEIVGKLYERSAIFKAYIKTVDFNPLVRTVDTFETIEQKLINGAE